MFVPGLNTGLPGDQSSRRGTLTWLARRSGTITFADIALLCPWPSSGGQQQRYNVPDKFRYRDLSWHLTKYGMQHRSPVKQYYLKKQNIWGHWTRYNKWPERPSGVDFWVAVSCMACAHLGSKIVLVNTVGGASILRLPMGPGKCGLILQVVLK